MKTNSLIYHVTEKDTDGVVLDMFFTSYKKAKQHVFNSIEFFDAPKGFYFRDIDLYEEKNYFSLFLLKHENGSLLSKHYGITA